MSRNFYTLLKTHLALGGIPVPGSPVDGDIWYDSGSNRFKKKENGTVSDLVTDFAWSVGAGVPGTGPLSTYCTWTSPGNAVDFVPGSNGSLTSTATGWSGFARDDASGVDGTMETYFVFSGTESVAGLSDYATYGVAGSTLELMHYGIRFDGVSSAWATQTDSSPIATVAATLSDVFSVARTGSVVVAKKNGVVFATFSDPATTTSIPTAIANNSGPSLSSCGVGYTIGINGDQYVDTGTGDLYKKVAGTWTIQTQVQLTSKKGVANGYASLDANALIPITQIPPAALERLIIVADQAARYALTTATAQNGDTVSQTDTQALYFVKDDTNLGNASGYQIYSAGTASSVPWSGITSVPAPVSSLTGTNSGDLTLGAVGSSPNSNAATLTGQALVLQPADATNPGVMTTGTQTIAGTKTFSSTITGSVSGNAGTATSAASLSGNLTGDVTSSGMATTYSGTVPLNKGGTGQTTQQLAVNAIAGAVTSGQYLRGNGTNVLMSTIQAADVPTLNQNTTGTASNVSGTVAIANGGTGQTGQTAAFDALSPNTNKGDLTVRGASNNVRLPVGTYGQALIADPAQTNGLGWATVPQGLKNYIQFASFENNATTGWSLGTATLTNNLPSGAPTFGSGYSGNLSIAATSSGPLAGAYSLSEVSSAATTAGNFLATDALTIDIEDQAKVLQFRFAYKTQVNPANGDFSGTSSNSFGVAIYDVTNSAWIIPAGVFNLVQNSGVGIASGTFQTTSNSTQYRLVIFNANASAGAITMYFDDFYLGPQITAAGAAMSDWTPYTPTFGAGLGTVTAPTFFWRRAGDSVEVMGRFTNGTVAASYASISLPSGMAIDTAKFASATTTSNIVGTWAHNNAANEFGNLLNATLSATSNTVVYFGTSTTVNQMLVPNFGNGIMSSNDVVSVTFEVPIAGWSSQTVMSADTDTRLVAMQVSQASPTWSGSGSFSLVKFTSSPSQDTTASYSVSTGLYTVPVSGDYDINAAFSIGGTWALNNKAEITIFKNGVAVNIQGSVFAGGVVSVVAPVISGTIPCVAGDTLALYALANNTSPVVNGNQPNNFLHIARRSGPATIAASESVSMRATSSTTSQTSSVVTVVNPTKTWDTHNMYNTSTGECIIPTPGKYHVTAMAGSNGTSSSNAVSGVTLYLYKNGSQYSLLGKYDIMASGNTYYPCPSGSDDVTCVPGDILTIRVQHNAAISDVALDGSAVFNHFSVTRTGN